MFFSLDEKNQKSRKENALRSQRAITRFAAL